MQKNTSTSDKFTSILSDLSSFVGKSDCTAVEPACASRDRSSFIQRVHSFESSTWFAKPCWLSPVVCARYGWINVDVDLLRCIGCQSVLVVRTPSSFDPVIYSACQKRLEEQLKCAAHHPCCTWPSCPTSEVIILAHSNSGSQASVVEDFISKALSLYSMKEALPAVDYACLYVTDSDISALCGLVRNSSDYLHSAEVADALHSAVLLALVGWELKSSSTSSASCASLQCSLCMRQPGLWNYVNITAVNCEPTLDYQTASLESLEDHSDHSDASPNQFDCDIVDAAPCMELADSSADKLTNVNDVADNVDDKGNSESNCVQLANDVSTAAAEDSLVVPVALTQDAGNTGNTQIFLGSHQENGIFSESPNKSDSIGSDTNGPRSPTVSCDEDEDIDNDASEVIDAEECGEHLDMDYESSSSELPAECENAVSSDPGDAEHSFELTDVDTCVVITSDDNFPSAVIPPERKKVNHSDSHAVEQLEGSATDYDDSENMAHLTDDFESSSDTVQKESDIVNADVDEETDVVDSSNETDRSDVLHTLDDPSYNKDREIAVTSCDAKLETSDVGSNATPSMELADSNADKLTNINDVADNVGDKDSLLNCGDSEKVSSKGCELSCDAVEDDSLAHDKCTHTEESEQESHNVESSAHESLCQKCVDTDIKEMKLHLSSTASDSPQQEESHSPASDSDSQCSPNLTEVVEDIRRLLADLLDLVVLDDSAQKSLKRHATDVPSDDLQPVCKRPFSTAIQRTVFNPVSEHRLWCPHIADVVVERRNDPAQDVACKPWLRYMRQLLPDTQAAVSKFRRSSIPDGIEHIRTIFRSWTSSP